MSLPELIPNAVALDTLPALSAGQVRRLADCWITTAQELVGVFSGRDATRRLLGRMLGVEGVELETVIAEARAAIPGGRSGPPDTMEEEARRAEFGLGALLLEPAEISAATRSLDPYVPSARAVLPARHDLLHQLPPSRSQGPRATCVAHAALAVREQLEIAAGAPNEIDLSEQFVYWWCKSNDGLPNVSGSYLSVGMRCLEAAGSPLEEAWPYRRDVTPDQGQGPPPPAASSGDRSFATTRTIQFNRADIQGIKSCLWEGRALAFSVPVFDSWYKSSACLKWGKITLPLTGEPNDGGHAMTMVGYQDDPSAPGGGYFIVRNSWHPWAWQSLVKPGYGYVPYAYISTHASTIFSAQRQPASNPYVRGIPSPSYGGLVVASPDVWLRRQRDGEEEPQSAAAGAASWLYVRLTNPGPAQAYNVAGDIYAKPAGAGASVPWQRAASFRVPWLRTGSKVLEPVLWRPPDEGKYFFGVRMKQPTDVDRPQFSKLGAV